MRIREIIEPKLYVLGVDLIEFGEKTNFIPIRCNLYFWLFVQDFGCLGFRRDIYENSAGWQVYENLYMSTREYVTSEWRESVRSIY